MYQTRREVKVQRWFTIWSVLSLGSEATLLGACILAFAALLSGNQITTIHLLFLASTPLLTNIFASFAMRVKERAIDNGTWNLK